MTLATRLPYSHPFAGGYPRIGGQPLPTDPDAIDYLQRQAAVDGPVEVGVAMAVDAFVKGCKADGIWSAIKASCIMAGARTISGALVPLVGDAPTPYNFTGSDYSRTTGLVGDGATTYLDSNYAFPADYQDDCHLSISISAVGTTGLGLGYGDASASGSFVGNIGARLYQLGTDGSHTPTDTTTPGFRGVSRSSAAEFLYRYTGATETASIPSSAVTHGDFAVFGRQRNTGTPDNLTDARLAFYSIGSSLDLALMDARVTNLISAIAAALA